MNELIDLSTKLVDSIYDQAQLAGEIVNLKEQLSYIELHITPEQGWQGKNEAERKISKDRGLESDGSWANTAAKLYQTEQALRDRNATIEALKTEIDTIKWLIRNETNVVLGGRDVFDLLADAAAERKLEAEQDKRDPEIEQVNFQSEDPTPKEAPDAWLDDRLDADNIIGDDDLPF